ncbi:MAG TPA: hypothetical protein VKZ85_08655 [Woeseiaceae bacterium]|nr:hypothetical protein [Woeseiaceae bacterium]
MNKTFWVAFVVVYVVLQVIGFLVHAVWLDDTYAALHGTVFRSEEEFSGMMWMMFVSSIVLVFLFCYIFTRGYEGRGIGEGIRYGLLLGVFFSVPMSLDAYVAYPLPLDLVITWFVTGLVNFVIGGILLSLIYKPTAPATAAATA